MRRNEELGQLQRTAAAGSPDLRQERTASTWSSPTRCTRAPTVDITAPGARGAAGRDAGAGARPSPERAGAAERRRWAAALGELAVRFGCELRGDPDATVERVAVAAGGGPGTLTFLANPRYRRHLAATRATAVVLDAAAGRGLPGRGAGRRPNPYATYARIAAAAPSRPPARPGVAPERRDRGRRRGGRDRLRSVRMPSSRRGAVIGARVLVGPGLRGHRAARTLGADTPAGGRRHDLRARARRRTLHAASGRRASARTASASRPSADGYVKVPQVGSRAPRRRRRDRRQHDDRPRRDRATR